MTFLLLSQTLWCFFFCMQREPSWRLHTVGGGASWTGPPLLVNKQIFFGVLTESNRFNSTLIISGSFRGNRWCCSSLNMPAESLKRETFCEKVYSRHQSADCDSTFHFSLAVSIASRVLSSSRQVWTVAYSLPRRRVFVISKISSRWWEDTV